MQILPLSLLDAPDLGPSLKVICGLVTSLMVATALVVRASPSRASPSTLRAQVTSWWRLMPPVVLAWALHPLGVAALVLAISALAAIELAALSARQPAANLRRRFAMQTVLQVAVSAMHLTLWGVVLMVLVAANELRQWRRAKCTRRDLVQRALFAIQASGLWCLVALPPASMPSEQAAAWFLYLCTVTALNDIAQFLVGTRFGRHRLAAPISPNKTWQGLGGGLLSSTFFSVLIGHTLGLASPLWLFIMGATLSITGLAGDLLFSYGKRLLNIKDYSRLIPGHGGILDRVDSLVLNAPVMLIALRLA